MMMTCRLLCALLVLALCCCPSVCVADAEPEVDVQGSSSTITATQTRLPDPNETADPKTDVVVVQPPSPPDPSQETAGQPGSPGLGSVPDQGNVCGKGPGVTPGEPQSNVVTNNLQTEGKDSMTGRQNGTNTSADKAAQEAKDAAQTTTTTTTTTKAPTTTTTTTTQAPSATTTEAPAVSTTRALSRLREIDGSLSSSAWVCAPLVLAASGLAYTTLG
ncbi:putative mucin TcMUCII [Trypanosoma cruzi]|uniref:Mucin TcMUCII, putative n=2 Tax=Trypanosoma cruzi TaxID=5693 RepID=Q4DTL4_TRYCC|nr:mucin TcMUCII, putative [Trypanosoma cruzi]EAN95858.1 mucin TcMUCII, putative [Trypanosoma cruzi]PWV15868.1 putative mucin TcMUCII [Trypanosoma cruzi]|eukprot:XP_817709.1 mucin TcMUCII [Trypanosoma cruzi strain CL Brener]